MYYIILGKKRYEMEHSRAIRAEVELRTNVDGSTSVITDDTTKSDIIITLEKVEDDHRWLMSVQ